VVAEVPVPPDRAQPKFQPLTINLTDSIREGLRKIADREVLSLSDVVRRACSAEISRRDADAESRHDA
jgi:hypothetical protein